MISNMMHKSCGLKIKRSIAPTAGSHICDISVGCENCDPEYTESVQSLNFDQVSIAGSSATIMEKTNKQLKSRSIRKRHVSIHNDETTVIDSECVSQPIKKCTSKKLYKKPRQNEVMIDSAGGTDYKEDSLKVAQGSKLSPDKVAVNAVNCKRDNILITVDSKTTVSEVMSVKQTSNGVKSHGRLSLKGRKEDSVAPIFKLSSSTPSSVEKAKPEGAQKDDVLGSTSESALVAAAPALVNLGNTCFFNSVIQVLYYTPAFIESIAILAAEISATVRDNDTLATLENCCVTQLSGFICWKFVERLHELFQLMQKVDERFSNGCVDVEAISPSAVLTQLEAMNTLFSGGQQQDAHELLRCIFSYIQDSIKLLNTHRSTILAAIKADEVSKLAKDRRGSEDGIKVDKKSSLIGKGAKSTKCRRSNGSESENVDLCESTTVSRITNFFARAGPKPKSVSDISAKTECLVDFIENSCEGLVERRTRCLECEQVTKCSESFQDVEVVVQKSRAASTFAKQLDDENGDDCWIVKSLEEIERLQGDNKYWCGECEHHVEAERSVIYHRVPEILTIQMKRFSAFSSGFFGGFTKTMDCVNIPFEMQCLEKNCRESRQTSHRYELFGILSHTGVSLSSGHYISYVLASGDAKLIEYGATSVDEEISRLSKSVSKADLKLGPWWYICDDDSVTAISQSDLQLKLAAGGATTPYLLFYRRGETQTVR